MAATRINGPSSVLAAVALAISCAPELPEPTDECTVSPSEVSLARKLLRSRGDEVCRGDCDEAYVLRKVAEASGFCDLVTVSKAGDDSAALTQSSTASSGLRRVHLMFESSKSVEGYLKGRSSIKDDLDDLLSRLTLASSPVADTVRVSFVGRRAEPYRGALLNFTERLRPGGLPSVGTSSSDVASLVGRCLIGSGPDEVAVLVSDFVFSPGRRYDPPSYLRRQQIRIREIADSVLSEREDFAVTLVAREADFDGTYFDYENNRTPYRGQRPIYFLVAGQRAGVAEVARVIARDNGAGDAVARFAGRTVRLPYRIDRAPSSGRLGYYDVRVREAGGEDALVVDRVAASGAYEDALAVYVRTDLSTSVAGEPSVGDLRVTSPDELRVEAVANVNDSDSLPHRLLLVHEGRVYGDDWRLEVPRGDAADLAARYLDDDRGNPAAFAGRTFGLQSLVVGLREAFSSSDATPLAELTIAVQR